MGVVGQQLKTFLDLGMAPVIGILCREYAMPPHLYLKMDFGTMGNILFDQKIMVATLEEFPSPNLLPRNEDSDQSVGARHRRRTQEASSLDAKVRERQERRERRKEVTDG